MNDDLVARARAAAPGAMNGAFLRELAAALEAKDARIAELERQVNAEHRYSIVCEQERDAALRRAEDERAPPSFLLKPEYSVDKIREELRAYCDGFTEAAIEIRDLRAALRAAMRRAEEAERDARRYRWLRENKYMDIAMCWFLPSGVDTPEDMDAGIDAAIDAAQEKP